MNNVAEIIVASGKTAAHCLKATALGGGIIAGKLNPAGGEVSPLLTREALNVVLTARYGEGFAMVVGNVAPDAHHANDGSLNEHNLPIPFSAALTAALGLPVGYFLTPTDISDLNYCDEYVDQVLRPLIAALAVDPTKAVHAVADPAAQKMIAGIMGAVGVFLVTKKA